MRRSDWIRFGATVAVVFAALGLLYPFWPLNKVVKLGLDLQGGTRLVLQAKGLEKMDPEKQRDITNQIVTIVQNRVDQYGLANVQIRPLAKGRIEVVIPGLKNPEEAKRLIGSTALLEFRKVIDESPNREDLEAERTGSQEILPSHERDANGNPETWYLVGGEPLLTGDVLTDARANPNTSDIRLAGYFEVDITFNAQGAKRFADVIRHLRAEGEVPGQPGDRLAIILDNVVYSAPVISLGIKQAAIQQGSIRSARITGKFTFDEAKLLAVVLRSGALPTEVGIAEEYTVGPTLGRDTIRRGMTALLISFILVLIYMVAYYRVMGLVADVALLVNMLIIFAALRAFGATLTMPGIAGIVLTIGMSVDANVIIFERIKEERRTGKAPKACISAGFAKSLSALLDAQITTIITAVILFMLGTGPVQGFGITLALGVAGSLFSALVVSRLLLETTGMGMFIPVKVQQQAPA
ncbi:protein translocase subunit SecD [Candidatus Bipolaricaulota bacterium]|nr:protein translocase subunit SecD [Candidatus Bipolaricaulota bacterium]